ncbi:MAG TPA: hypothetical protein VGD72_14250 [Mycobacteriales bacterium]
MSDVDTPGPGRADRALRVAGGVVAFLWGAGSALVEGLLTPLRLAGWPAPVAPLLAAALGVPLVVYATVVTGHRFGGLLPAAGWLGAVSLLVVRTPEGDLLLPESGAGYALFLAGTLGFLVGLYRSPYDAGRRWR